MRKSNTWARKRRAASERGRRMSRARWAMPRSGEASADTVRARALRDAKGLVLREGVTYRGDGTETPWQVRRAVEGRTDQVEIVAAGQIVRTVGRTRLRGLLPGKLAERGTGERTFKT